ncbi:MAG: PAS domain-containing protein [Deltaproteobacteria bacterium]|nr:MAG: PAS domain-containing protein [Deltaproteobacteria bacterium]
MNIAVVGGGTRCRILMDSIDKHSFREISPKVVAVADSKEDAPGLVKAREKHLFVTSDYNDIFDRDDIDLIVELTGNQAVYDDILLKKKESVRAINHKTATLFWEFTLSSRIEQKARKKLQETRAIYNVLINELIQEDVIVMASNYRVLDINETLAKKMGIERKDAIGRYCYQLLHRESAPCSGEDHPCPLVQTVKTGKPFRVTHVHFDKGDRELFYSISCYPLIDNGEVVGAIEIARDITKDIDIQKVMMQHDKMASIGRLAAGVAHEINNPLTTILTSAMLIQEDTDPGHPNYQELQTIADEALRCRKIVSSLLDFARQSRPIKRSHQLNDVVAESVMLTRKQAAFNDITLEQRLSEHLPPNNMDKDQLEQVLINLILNAIEATDPGGKVTISTSLVPEADKIKLTVSDSGKGISGEDMDRIFDPFFTTRESGTGLGLAITQGIIEQHGGTIEVNSQLGQGTSFTIELPLDHGDNDGH